MAFDENRLTFVMEEVARDRYEHLRADNERLVAGAEARGVVDPMTVAMDKWEDVPPVAKQRFKQSLLPLILATLEADAQYQAQQPTTEKD